MSRNITLLDLLDPRKINHCVKSRQKRYLAGKKSYYPWSVEIHPTTRCNYDCTYCAYHLRNEANQSIPEDALKSLFDTLILNRAKGIFFSGGGEPLLYSGLEDHIIYLERRGIEVAVLTNGSLLADEKYSEMISSLNYIAISIPSLVEEEFRIMTGRKMPAHLPDLPNFLRSGRRKVPIIGSRLVICSQNFKNIFDTILKIKSAGYDYCITKIAKDPEGRGLGLSQEEMAYLEGKFAELSAELPPDFTNIGDIIRGQQFERPKGDICWALEYAANCFINTDGGVYLCLPLIGNKEYCIGNIKDENFDDIWKGQRRVEVIARLQERYKSMECKGCRNISYNNIVEGYPDSGFSKNIDPFL
jgi:radical SAM protein with 4Fe4S-binding SPASM domain